MKRCRVCDAGVVIELRQHNAAFCKEHFLRFCRNQVAKSIEKHDMFASTDRVLVAVSGGKDSLALWDILVELGYDTHAVVLGLGIGDYSATSTSAAVNFAAARGLELTCYDLGAEVGFDIPGAAEATGRVPCSACGLSKRHILDRLTVERGYDVLVTGHNLDDEAAVLFGNVVHWKIEFLARQAPVLPAGNGFPRKAKPLIRLGEREMAAYCVLRGIDYIVEECPMAAGNKHLAYKELLNDLELRSPGSKQQFYFGFLDRIAGRLAGQEAGRRDGALDGAGDTDDVGTCSRCGSPSSGSVCAFCRLRDRAETSVVGGPDGSES